MIFYDDIGRRKESPTVLFYEKAEEINALKTLEVVIINAEVNKYDRIYHEGMEYIVDEPTESRDHGLTRELLCVSVEAELYDHYIEDIRPEGNADAALARILNGTRFTVGQVDDLGTRKLFLYQVNGLEALAQLCKEYGCEYRVRIENGIRYIDLKKRIGKDLGKRAHYSKDLQNIKRTVKSANICTRLYVYGKGEESGEGWGRRISIDTVNGGKKYLEDEALRQAYGVGAERLHRQQRVVFDDIDDPAELLQLGTKEFEERSTHQVTYQGSILNLGKMGLPHENVELGDSVTIYDEEFKPPLEVKARVVRIIETSATEQKLITLGNYRDNFVEEQRRLEDEITRIREKSVRWEGVTDAIENGNINFLEGVLEAVNKELDSLTGYAKLVPGRGLVVPNAKDESQATHVVEVGGGYIRFANSRKANGEWNYRSITDASGVIADSITAGILQGGKVKFNLETGTFLIGDSTEDYKLFFDGTTLHIDGTAIDITNNSDFSNLSSRVTANAQKIETKVSAQQIIENPELQELLKGAPGEPGANAPVWSIGQDGYWYKDGVKTTEKSKGEDGGEWTIGSDDYWYYNGQKTNKKAVGKDAEPNYTWIRWADTPTSGMSPTPTNKKYLGIGSNKKTSTPSSNYDDYIWTLIEGPPGADGRTPEDKFVWIKYADDNKGGGLSDLPNGKRWLGVAVNKETNIESLDYNDYTWSPLYDNTVTISNTQPTNPNIAQLWLDSSAVPNVFKRWTGDTWETVSDTAELEAIINEKADKAELDEQLNGIVESIEESITSQISQTNKTVDFNFTTLLNSINELGQTTGAFESKVETNIRFTAEGIELGRSDNKISIKILPDRLSFYESGKEVAYFSDKKLYVTQIEIIDSLVIGDWAFTPRANGNLSFGRTR